jgi:hypothetical protein
MQVIEVWEDFGEHVVAELVRQTSMVAPAPGAGDSNAAGTSASADTGDQNDGVSGVGGWGQGESAAGDPPFQPRPPAERAAREMFLCTRVDFKLDAKARAAAAAHKHKSSRFKPHRPPHSLPRMPTLSSPPVEPVAAPPQNDQPQPVLFDARVTHQHYPWPPSRSSSRRRRAPPPQGSMSAREPLGASRATTLPAAPRSHRHTSTLSSSRGTGFNSTSGSGHVISDTFANRSKYRRLRKAGGVADTFDPWGQQQRRHAATTDSLKLATTINFATAAEQAAAATSVTHHVEYSYEHLPAEVFQKSSRVRWELAVAPHEVSIGGALAPSKRAAHPLRPSARAAAAATTSATNKPHRLPHLAATAREDSDCLQPQEQEVDFHSMPPAAGTYMAAGWVEVGENPLLLQSLPSAAAQPHRYTAMAMHEHDFHQRPVLPGPSRGIPVAGLPRTPRTPHRRV